MNDPFDPARATSDQADRRPSRFKLWGSVGVGAGLAAMFTGSAISQQGPESFLTGLVISVAGWSSLLLGCVSYARWKGYTGWLGLLGYGLLPGLIILVCLPNRRRRLTGQPQSAVTPEPGTIVAQEALAAADRTSGSRYVFILIPLAMLFASVVARVLSVKANLDTTLWQNVASSEDEFAVLLPGTPEVVKNVLQETPAGNVELHKYSVMPEGRKELYMIVVNRFPDDVGRTIGGASGLLELGRKDVLESMGGRLKSERPIELAGCPGLELEVLPPEGAIQKCRVYAARNALYEVCVHVPQFRLASRDVQKFFDSFTLTAKPSASEPAGP
jgi:hypothetical protein